MKINLSLLIIFIAFAGKTVAQKKFDVYYISIGSTYYHLNPAFYEDKYDILEDAGLSATIMANCLSKYANAKGEKFISTEKNMLSKAILKEMFNKVWEQMIKDKPANPLVVFYFCGHGFNENLINSQFLLVGDCSTMDTTEYIDTMMKKHVFVPQIADIIFKHSIAHMSDLVTPRYMLLLDCCRDKKQDDALNMNKTKATWGPKTNDIKLTFDKATRDMIQLYKTSEKFADPIIYATQETKKAIFVDIPKLDLQLDGLKDAKYIGPICRRTLLLINKTVKDKSDVSLESFVTGIIKQHDAATDAPVTPYTTGRPNNDLFLTTNNF